VNPSRSVVHVRIASLRAGVAAAGVLLALAGCSVTNPATIATPFDPANGSNGQIDGEPGTGGGDGNYLGNGGIKLRNFLIVSSGGQAAGVVVGAISNDTDKPAQVSLTVANPSSDQAQELGTTTISLQPGEVVQLGNPAGASGAATPGSSASTPVGSEPAQGQTVWFQVKNVSQPAGSFLQLLARDPARGSVNMNLPILPPVDEYASLTPTSGSPSASGSASPTASPTSSPSSSPTSSP
jgi:hypothetical protein